MKRLYTTLGLKSASELGIILPHEHVFTDLRTCDQEGFAVAETADVIKKMVPELDKARDAGITALVECTPVGVGRRADILKAVSDAADFPLVVPTGVYREPWIPPWVHEAGEESLKEWMLGELEHDIEGTGIQADWIKLSAGDNGLTGCEAKVLKAAAYAGVKTGALIGSHTIRGAVALEQIEIIEKAGYTPERFLWIHAHVEPDFNIHLEMAKRGAWVEYDAIGGDAADEFFIRLVVKMVDAGFADRILLSQDRGYYNPAKPDGGEIVPYTYILDTFLEKLRSSGIDDKTADQLMRVNPFNAFAR